MYVEDFSSLDYHYDLRWEDNSFSSLRSATCLLPVVGFCWNFWLPWNELLPCIRQLCNLDKILWWHDIEAPSTELSKTFRVMLLAAMYSKNAWYYYFSRKHTLRVYRGDRTIFPKQWVREASHSILVSITGFKSQFR